MSFSAVYAGGSVVFFSWRGEFDGEALLLAAENVSRRVSASDSSVLVMHFSACSFSPAVRESLASLIERAKACGVKTLRLISKDAFLRMAVSTICLSLRIRYESHEDVTTALSTPIT